MGHHRAVSVRRILAWAAVAVLGTGALLLWTADVRVGESNCGSALVTRDPTRLSVESGHPIDDEMRNAIVRERCGHSITNRRIVGALPALAAVALAVWASRPEPRDRFDDHLLA